MKKILLFLIFCCISLLSFGQIAPITGPTSLCVGSTITLSDATPAGTWSSDITAVATIGSGSGVVSGVSAGTTTITYSTGSGTPPAFYVITVNPLPAPIAASLGLSVCVGNTITVSDATPGGTWESGTTTVATIGTSSGVVTGVSPGTSVITYTLPTGCSVTATVTVNPNPGAIFGNVPLCVGGTITLTDATVGGTWTSANTSIADVGSASGVVTGNSAGTTTITYSVGTGCSATVVVTVNPLPGIFTGGSAAIICVGNTLTLIGTPPGGTWTSGNTVVAVVGSSSGVVTGISPGSASITYTLATGCYSVVPLLVNPNPGPITGVTSVCAGFTTSLTDATTGGTWSSAMIAIADVGSSSGIVVGNSPGTTTITYTLPTGCYATTTVTVYVQPAPISAGSVFLLCLGSSITISDATPGGSWSSSNTSVATIGSSTGVVTGVSLGSATISYVMPGTGCYVTTPVFVVPNPGPITGNTSVCVGFTTTLSNATPGGTWSSASTSIADVGSTSGVVTGNSPGTTTITYTLSTGCYATTIVTVNPQPAPIAVGSVFQVCVGGTITITDATPGGTWSSQTTTVATVGSTSGVVTGVSPGVSNITYMLATGCYVTTPVFVNPNPGPILGNTSICVGSASVLSDAITGGTWTSSNTTVATITGGTGVVIGVSVGTTTITYTLPTGCYVTTTVTVNPIPAPITGPNIVCVGSTITLSDATPGGTWSSSNTLMATIGSTTGVVTGVSLGGVTITYMLSTGCAVTYFIKVIAPPTPIITPSTGNLCVGGTITLTDATPGGTWASGNTSVAIVGSGSGVVTGVSPGTATITYTVFGGCYVTTTVTVLANPAPITGVLNICVGNTTTLSDASPGGTWSSGNTSVATITGTGVATGLSPGTSVITYTLPSGCFVTAVLTVWPLPAPITGPSTVCVGGTITLSDATPGGTWSSLNTVNATVGSSSGVVTGVALGFTVITYMLPSGCYVTKTIKVVAGPAPITGITIICAGMTTTLSDATPGGTWSSSNTVVATVAISGGVVTGITPGTTTITYMMPTGCFATITVTVNPNPTPILGPNSVCVGSTITLSDATPGGIWTSNTPTVATVGSGTGVVTGISVGFTTITYMLPSGCYVTTMIKVKPLPSPITGVTTMCLGIGTILSDATPGGTWTSGNTPVATITAGTGVVTSISAGTAMITYTAPSGCYATITLTVNPIPAPVSGPSSVCVGMTITLTDATPGGTWSSGNTLVASVGSSTGVVTGIAVGTVTITYTLPTGCFVKFIVNVTPIPCNVGVNELVNDSRKVELYPNPAFDELIIKADAGAYNSIVITNELGQVVMRKQLSGLKTSLDIKLLTPGMYYVLFNGDSGSTVRKFLKQ